MRVTLPHAARNPVSLIGVAIATAMAVVFAVFFALDTLGLLTGPYIGLLVFVTVPALFVAGLILVPLGAWWSARRHRAHPGAAEWPVIDLSNPRHRTIAASVFVLTLVNMVIVSLAAYGGVHYMDSTQFCGQACHTTMEPEAVAHQRWAHAEVGCTQCHIGPGAGAFVQAKLAGTRQLFEVMTGKVPRPIPPPQELIQPARNTCEVCHSRLMRRDDELRIVREYASDEANTPSQTTLRMHLGSAGFAGIHRHIGMAIEFVAADPARETILAVRLRTPAGAVKEYVAEKVSSDQIAHGTVRQMDCIDCHNRPAHTFAPTPQRAIDAALAAGRIPGSLPFVRREALAAISADYADRASAAVAISKRLGDFYRGRSVDAGAVRAAIAGTEDAWASNVFPQMKVTWGTYPNHLGHIDTPGCFRCHDDSHKAADGATISQDCELCHTIQE